MKNEKYCLYMYDIPQTRNWQDVRDICFFLGTDLVHVKDSSVIKEYMKTKDSSKIIFLLKKG